MRKTPCKCRLLSQIDHEIHRLIADGIDDQQPVYAAVEDHSPGAQVIVPPRKVAALSPAAATAPTQRDQHIASIERDGVFAWKRTSGYYAQSHAENAFARYKRTFGGHMRAKLDESQEREAAMAASCSIGCGHWAGRVLSRPLRAVFEGAVRGLDDSCNKSKSIQMHDIVIGIFVNRYAFGLLV